MDPMEIARDDVDDDLFALDDVPEVESIIGAEYNAVNPAGELPSRALIGCDG